MAQLTLHAGLMAKRIDGLWRGALLRGPSGVGKSDLALRARDGGLVLVADDYTVVFACAGRLFGRAPEVLSGRIEARGVGIVGASGPRLAEIVIAVDCMAEPAAIERLPTPQAESILGLSIPVLRIMPLEASAPAKLGRAISHLGAQRQQGYQAALWPGASPVEGGWREL